ncbi:MAG: sigma-70 family RNA polymerase sigma factor [Jiangellaceae bacterium]|nr:sigma-70 family RNA polymerase sigma factor [Jiangellaceae bacterium]
MTGRRSHDQRLSSAVPAGGPGTPAAAGKQQPGPPAARSLPPDEELVTRLRTGDEAAFALLVDAWSSGMLRLARAFVSTHESAAEVVQEAWLAVVEGLAAFEGRSSLRTWVYRILVNIAKRRGARESRSVPWSSLSIGDEEGPTVDPGLFRGAGEPYAGHWREFPALWPSSEQQVLAGEVRAQIAAALARLPGPQRIVITLRDVEGYAAAEVCSILDISSGYQRVLLHRARASVRGWLEDYFATGRRTGD